MAAVREEEARYQVTQLVKGNSSLVHLLFKLQGEGAGWPQLLEALQRADAKMADEGQRTSIPPSRL